MCVGFSGGVDSVVLLDAMAREGARPVTAVHVHHGLSPNADRWADFCRDFCAARAVPLSIERVTVDRAAAEGLEAAARTQRYAIYAARPEPYVALAHHLDDQAETVLLQLLRGTGLKGIAAMPEMRPLPGSHVRLYRPLLSIPRADLVLRARTR
ncbi:MAG TPA: tRNA lysidine(34) synthetase TilS, partial [Usitatibacter sp.]|nr:tRNA lysidine(34) synthetase TilS [Usitatibacter sp.]